MAQYKVIQDIEAEDKLLGPLSLRQFIYAGAAALLGYLSFIALSKGAAFLLAIFLPPMLFCMFFAWPWSQEQPTEVWALARIRFLFKPRKRIWNQSGVKELVTITVPKHVERVYTNGLTQTEVKSRLTALADTIDSRGWAIKNADVSMSTLPAYDPNSSDRLITATMAPSIGSDVSASDDMMDEHNNPIAQQFDQMIQASSQAHRQQIIDRMNSNEAPAPSQPATIPNQEQPTPDYWFLHQPSAPTSTVHDPNAVVFANPLLVQPGSTQVVGTVAAQPTPSEEELAQQIMQQKAQHPPMPNMHLKTINPLGSQPAATAQPQQDPDNTQTAQTQSMTPESDAAILNLASNNDLDVATIARQAEKARHPDSPDDEVVITLR